MFWHNLFSRKKDTATSSAGTRSTKSYQMPREPESDQEAESWHQVMTGLEQAWSNLDLERLWSIHRTDLNRDLKQAKDSTSSGILFTEEEQAEKRAEMLAFLKQDFFARMLNELDLSWWQRLFLPPPPDGLDEAYVRDQYHKAGKAKNFDNELKLYTRKKSAIEHYDPNGLFDNSERAGRMFPQTKQVRNQFQSFQQTQYKLYNEYFDRVSALPFDDIEDQLIQLAKDYEFLGRSREWFREFEEMIKTINSSVPDVDEGQNESVIRILQNDFLVVMQSRFSIYWRYHELKIFCQERKLQEFIIEMEQFDIQLAEMDKNGTPTQEKEQLLQDFVKTLESRLTRSTEQKPSRDKLLQDQLHHDHQARLSEWAQFKQTFNIPADPVSTDSSADHYHAVTAFNRLRPILRQCAEWQHELRVFRSMIKAKRSMDPRQKNSDAEHRDLLAFMSAITTRIENEIATDVAFRSLEQDLIKNKQFLVDLIITRKKLALEKQLRSARSAEVIDGIKQDFVRLIWEKRNPETKGGSVTPLLPPRRKGRF